ncbi:BT2A1 protein, partial [Polypterus senegalus]|nr:BT2A1 protein [Polypterus senegalus]
MGLKQTRVQRLVFIAHTKGFVFIDSDALFLNTLALTTAFCGFFSERFQVVGPSSSVLVHVGEDVTLPASLSPVISAQRFEVRWFRNDFTSPVLLYQNLQIRPERQMQAYKGRAALFTEELKNGNVSLRLQDVRVSDGGLYKCFVDSGPWNEEVHITLNVEALGGQPSISIGSTEDQQTRLECKADKWGTTPDVA